MSGSRTGRGKGHIWQTRKGGPWHAYAYESGRWVRRSTKLKDRAAARTVADRWLREGERAEATGDVLINQERRPIAEHLEDFAKANRENPKDLTPGHVERKIDALKSMATLAGWEKLTHITLQSAQELLQRLRRGDLPTVPSATSAAAVDPTDPRRPKQAARPGGGRTGAKARAEAERKDRDATGLAPSTLNLRRAYLKNFTRWLHQKGRLLMDPLAGLQRFRTQGFETKRRRALTLAEQQRFVAAAERGPDVGGISGPDRAMLYRFALATGFRKSECASLSVSSFNLDARIPHVRLTGNNAKNRKTVEQPLPRSIVPLLRSWLMGRVGSRAVWPGLAQVDTAGLVKGDLARAKIEVKNSAGVVDFHALRHTFGTTLAVSGATPAEAQRLMRHSTMELTMRTYTHITDRDIAKAVSGAFDVGAATPDRPQGGVEASGSSPEIVTTEAEESPEVAQGRCSNRAITSGLSRSSVDDDRDDEPGGGTPGHRETEAEMSTNGSSGASVDSGTGRIRTDVLAIMSRPDGEPCDSKSLMASGVTATPSGTLQQACSSGPGGPDDVAIQHRGRPGKSPRRTSVRERAAAGLTPDLERAFDHIRDLGSIGSAGAGKGGAA